MKLTLTAGLAAAAILAACPASACGGGKALFSDDFKQVDASWGFDSPDVQVEEGKVKVKPQPDISNLLVYKGLLFGDADYCLTVRTPNKLGDNDNTMAGPIFWAKDYDNYYMFMITPSGFAEVARKVDGKFITVVDWKQVADVKRPPGSNNVLEVRTLGSDIAVFINDAPFATLKGQAPDGGGQIGMRAQSEKSQVDTWKFSQLAVYAVPGSATATPPSGPAPATVAPRAPDAAGQTPPQPPAKP
jgi:hypothetical protein